MRTEIPAGTLELLTVPGLRPDKALKLYKELGISSVEDLEQAAKQERLKNVKGLGSALQRSPARHRDQATRRGKASPPSCCCPARAGSSPVDAL
jgi:DNA polymerase/3'-5' exonuclease PolX